MGRWSTTQRVAAATVAVVLLLGAGVLVWQVTRPKQVAVSEPTTTFVAAQRQTVRKTVTAAGTIAPQRQSYLSFPASGTVSSVRVNLGDTVKAGTVLATQDTTTLDAAVTSAEAAASAARSSLRTVLDTSGATDSQIASARAQVASADAQLAQARSDLAGATMTSPIDGVVAEVNITKDAKVMGTSSVTTGTGTTTTISPATAASAQVVVVDITSWQVDATVGMADLAQLKQGMSATIAPTGTDARLPATIHAIGIVGTTTTGQATYPITLHIDGNPPHLYIGGTADATIEVGSAEVLTVPTAAVTTVDGQARVTVMRGGTATAVPVTVGRTVGTSTEIVEGVSEGEQVEVPLAAVQSGSATSPAATPSR